VTNIIELNLETLKQSMKMAQKKKTKYVEWIIERGKTRTGAKAFIPDRPFNPKMYATGGERCPVRIFEEYIKRRPESMNSPHSPFYLATIQKPTSTIWYKTQPLGVNSLCKFMREIAQSSGLTGRFTNHSARRTMLSTLRKENVEPLNIIDLAGQRNLKSLDSYSMPSNEQQKDMSNKISSLHQEQQKSPAQNHSQASAFHPLATSGEYYHPLQAGMFSGATFHNCSFSLDTSASNSGLKIEGKSPCRKLRRIRPLSDSDED